MRARSAVYPAVIWTFVFGLGLLTSRLQAASAMSATPILSEPEIKAAAFYNVVTFTNWPAEAFASPDAALVIGIVGVGPVATIIERITRGEQWRGRKILVEKYPSADEIKPCHVLFVARSERQNWTAIRQRFVNQPMLAISDADNFAAQGGNVQLAIEHNKLRILVNLAATRASKLQLSSNLLHLSTIIGPMPDLPNDPRSGSQSIPNRWLQVTWADVP